MSTYYAFSCRDCGESSGRAFNHAPDRAAALLGVLGCVEAIETADPWGMFEVTFGDGEARALVDFARCHRGHELIVVSEYERFPEPVRQCPNHGATAW
jgi:hypothetical protein